MRTKLTGAVVGLNALVMAAAMAHEGPPGHTHGEEWPFGPLAIALGAGVLISIAAFRKLRGAGGSMQAVGSVGKVRRINRAS